MVTKRPATLSNEPKGCYTNLFLYDKNLSPANNADIELQVFGKTYIVLPNHTACEAKQFQLQYNKKKYRH